MSLTGTSKLNADNNINAVRPESATPRKALAMATFVIRKLVGGDRFKHLTNALAATVARVNAKLGHKAKLLDYGCGNMAVGKALYDKGVAAEVTGVDTYDIAGGPVPQGVTYQKIDGQTLGFPDASFDAAIIIDVLHHAGIENSVEILKEVSRCTRYVIVKDHVEYGPVSRQILAAGRLVRQCGIRRCHSETLLQQAALAADRGTMAGP